MHAKLTWHVSIQPGPADPEQTRPRPGLAAALAVEIAEAYAKLYAVERPDVITVDVSTEDGITLFNLLAGRGLRLLPVNPTGTLYLLHTDTFAHLPADMIESLQVQHMLEQGLGDCAPDKPCRIIYCPRCARAPVEVTRIEGARDTLPGSLICNRCRTLHPLTAHADDLCYLQPINGCTGWLVYLRPGEGGLVVDDLRAPKSFVTRCDKCGNEGEGRARFWAPGVTCQSATGAGPCGGTYQPRTIEAGTVMTAHPRPDGLTDYTPLQTLPGEPRSFCPRCGKPSTKLPGEICRNPAGHQMTDGPTGPPCDGRLRDIKASRPAVNWPDLFARRDATELTDALRRGMYLLVCTVNPEHRTSTRMEDPGSCCACTINLIRGRKPADYPGYVMQARDDGAGGQEAVLTCIGRLELPTRCPICRHHYDPGARQPGEPCNYKPATSAFYLPCAGTVEPLPFNRVTVLAHRSTGEAIPES